MLTARLAPFACLTLVTQACAPTPALRFNDPAPIAAPRASSSSGARDPLQTPPASAPTPPGATRWSCVEPASNRTWLAPFTGGFTVAGPADDEAARELTTLLPSIVACRASSEPGAVSPSARLWFELTLTSSGETERLCTAAEGGMSPALATCLTTALQQLKRPITPYGTRIRSSIVPASAVARPPPVELPWRCGVTPAGKAPTGKLTIEQGGVSAVVRADDPRSIERMSGVVPARDEVDRCYAEALTRDLREGGQLSYDVQLDARGKVLDVCSGGEGPSEALRSCVERALRREAFVGTAAPTAVHGTYWFKSAHGDWSTPAQRTTAIDVGRYHQGQRVSTGSVGDDPSAPAPAPAHSAPTTTPTQPASSARPDGRPPGAIKLPQK